MSLILEVLSFYRPRIRNIRIKKRGSEDERLITNEQVLWTFINHSLFKNDYDQFI